MNNLLPKTYCVTTFGCQMNARDSEKIEGMLEELGYTCENDELNADIIIFNTCSVRENANEKLYGHLGRLKSYKAQNPYKIIGICGCMMQDEIVVDYINKHYPFVDIIFGTHNLASLPNLLEAAIHNKTQQIEILPDTSIIREDLPSKRHFKFKASVNITYGCNNFCTYCIVPYVRGRLKSRQKEDIINECKYLISDGVKEIMLLGQNVNEYGSDIYSDYDFANLLDEIASLDNSLRIRFMTSHPKDMSNDIIDVIKSTPNICNQLHLPLQSGSDRILKAMNRKYDSKQYLDVVNYLKKDLDNYSISTDIIVGFPGETEEDFNETLKIVKEVGFNNAFTFIYSPRSHTRAAKMKDKIDNDVINDRFERLLQIVKEESKKAYENKIGNIEDVLVEKVNKKDDALASGRTMSGELVHFKCDQENIGTIQKVKLIESKGFYFIGE